MSNYKGAILVAMVSTALLSSHVLGQPAVPAASAVSESSWPHVTRMADLGPRQYSAVRTGTFGGRKLRYKAELSEMLVSDRTGKPAASMFTTAFIATGETAARPVVFFFNGGPGGSSNTLMFGAIGPQRLQKFDPAAMADPRTPLVANEETILDSADLVLIDAPETGYGRPLAGSDPKTFRSNDGDASAFAQVIQRWLTEHGRLASPVFLAGESYGTVRAVLLARDLRVATPRVELAGLVLISQAMWYNGPDTNDIKRIANPVRAINSLPDIAALSWYHGLIDNKGQTLEQAVRAAQAFALGDYAGALVAGERLPAPERKRIADRLAELTGVPAAVWTSNGLRLQDVRKQLLASRNLALGQFDGRETEPLAGAPNDADRDFKGMMTALTLASERTAREVFHATGLPEYLSIVPDPFGFEKSWSFIVAPNPGPDIILREQMAANPNLRLLVTQGVFDTTTTMGETDYQFSQIGTPRDRTSFAYYPGGHMLYSDDDGRRAFLQDLRAFVSGRAAAPRAFPQPAPAPTQKP